MLYLIGAQVSPINFVTKRGHEIVQMILFKMEKLIVLTIV